MRTTSPLSADDDLFVTKGQATPLEQTRPEETPANDGLPPSPISQDFDTATLPGIFADTPDEDPAEGDNKAEDGSAGTEPPPAASLLAIATQGSAARSRLRVRPPPQTGDGTANGNVQGETETTKSGEPLDANTSAENDTVMNTGVYLPVPVRINLPSVIAPIADPKPPRWKKTAMLAGCVAVMAAGSIAIFGTQSKSPPDAQADLQFASEGQLTNTASISDSPAEPAAATANGRTTTEIDSVRFGNAGRVVVRGRATPGSELIVLRNRQPLGAARADDSGKWSFTTRVPMRIEQHEISVAPLQIDTTVTVDKPAFAPRPRRRPALPSPTATSYFVQIASLPSAADAEREAAKLTSKLSGAIAADKISVRAATIEQGRTVYRVAIVGFTTKHSADTACVRIRIRKAPCLVMREP
jgi:hypothetical protein